MASVQQLREVSWSVVCAACCHMALVFAAMYLYNTLNFCIASVDSFFDTFVKYGIDNSKEWSAILPACHCLMCFFFNRGNIEETNFSENLCLMFVIFLFDMGLCQD